MLFDREKELDELNFVLDEPGSHFLTVSGRRRLGKTTLLVEWAKSTGLPAVYWVASRVSPVQLLRSFSQSLYNHALPTLHGPCSRVNVGSGCDSVQLLTAI